MTDAGARVNWLCKWASLAYILLLVWHQNNARRVNKLCTGEPHVTEATTTTMTQVLDRKNSASRHRGNVSLIYSIGLARRQGFPDLIVQDIQSKSREFSFVVMYCLALRRVFRDHRGTWVGRCLENYMLFRFSWAARLDSPQELDLATNSSLRFGSFALQVESVSDATTSRRGACFWSN
ncbi:hypothetical protein B0H11DRAFT_373202 [Mycena galericulata]|nr:hypothetical protein B0H11DRAFT_373202 [Mycena galericulata]